MKILLLFSGQLRTFNENLQVILDKIKHDKNNTYDIYLYNTYDDDETYNNIGTSKFAFENINLIVNDDMKSFNCRTITDKITNKVTSDRKIINTIKQWYKFYKLFNYVKDDYDVYVRMRPDIEMIDSFDFANIDMKTLYVPSGNDIYDVNIFNIIGNFECINDQLAFGSYAIMKTYSELYLWLNEYCLFDMPFISELLLHKYLLIKNIKINRITLAYKLNLSLCNIVAISGDSGAGKSTLMETIKSVFLFDNYIQLETDRYHKWERHDPKWTEYTHLHPESNHLEKMHDDVFNLRLGNDVYSVDYDHDTGKFTTPQLVESKDNVILCGLHTWYKNDISKIINIKIYIDTQREIKIIWKLRRDIEHRGHTYEKVMNSIKIREQDFINYIEPQKYNADIIVRYYTDDAINIDKNTYHTEQFNINYGIYIKMHTIDTFKLPFINFVKSPLYENYYECICLNEHDILQYIQLHYPFITDTKTSYLLLVRLLLVVIMYK